MTVGDSPSIYRLFVYDCNSRTSFLVDTGSDISTIPRHLVNKHLESSLKLQAANGTHIKTYGYTQMILNLKLRREFTWRFIISDVNIPILGADFLAYYSLVPKARIYEPLPGACQR